MANSPAAPPNGTYRVVRVHKHVTEAYVTAANPTAAKAAARALPPQDWIERTLLQTATTDQFEYDVVSSDDGA
jgi:hypothetical protein